jgi:hypothetical protein
LDDDDYDLDEIESLSRIEDRTTAQERFLRALRATADASVSHDLSLREKFDCFEIFDRFFGRNPTDYRYTPSQGAEDAA